MTSAVADVDSDVSLFEIRRDGVPNTFPLGGGSGQILMVQAHCVARLPAELFAFTLAITYMSPGPRTAFISGVGYYLAGLPGAAVAFAGLIRPTCLGAAAANYALTRLQRVIRVLTPSLGSSSARS